MKNILYIFWTLGLIASFLVLSHIQKNNINFGAGIFQVIQGGTGASTLTGCLTGNGTSPITGSGVACGSSDWNKQTNYGVLTLTPTTTIPVWFKDQIFASSSAIFGGVVTASGFTGTSSIASIFPYASTTQITSSQNAWFVTSGTGGVIIGATSTPVRSTSLLTVGPRSTSSVAPQNVIASFTGHFGSGTSTVLYSNDNNTADVGFTFESTIVGNANPFTSGCEWSGFDTSAFSGTFMKWANATAQNTCSTPAMTLKSSKLGIGTTTPATALDVVGTVRAQAEAANVNNITNDIEVRRTTNDSLLYAGFRTAPDSWIISSTFLSNGAYKPLSFATSDTIRQTILANGNVGIGTSTPGSTLSVNGTITSTSTAPTLSSCGTSPSVIGNANYGEVTAGATASACTVTFATAYPVFASCTVTPQTGSITNTFSYTVSKSAITATETALGGTKFNYSCSGY